MIDDLKAFQSAIINFSFIDVWDVSHTATPQTETVCTAMVLPLRSKK
jgi:hypothetical protein